MDYDIRTVPPAEAVYNLGRSLATYHHNVGACALAFHARPDDWMTPDEMLGWSMLTEDEAWRLLRRGFEVGPDPDVVERHRRHPELGALDA